MTAKKQAKTSKFHAQLRRLMMLKPERVRDFLITEGQRRLVQLVGHGVNTAHDLAISDQCSIQNASGQLAKLYKKGYLQRYQRPDPSGGVYYFYTRLV